jgi:hypothetical protein
MRTARGLVVGVALLASCKTRRHEAEVDRTVEAQAQQIEDEIARLERALGIADAGPLEAPVPDAGVEVVEAPGADTDTDADAAAPPCIDLSELTSVRFAAASTVVCQDADDEGASDCFTVSHKGVVTSVVHHDAPSHARVTVTDDIAEICPPRRACVRIGPALADGETVQYAEVSHETGAVVALVIGEPGLGATRLELWDLTTGALRGRADLTDLDADGDVEIELAGDTVLLIHDGDDTDLMHATLFGLDGKRRVRLAGGSGRIRYHADSDRMATAFTLGTEDVASITGYDRRTGKLVGHRDLTPVDPDLIDMDDAGGHSVVLVFDGDHPRLEVIDLATGKTQTRTVPVCE